MGCTAWSPRPTKPRNSRAFPDKERENGSSDIEKHRLVTVARFDSTSEAQLVASKLSDAGLPFHITTGQIPGLPMFYGSGRGSVRLQVSAGDREEAEELLGELGGKIE